MIVEEGLRHLIAGTCVAVALAILVAGALGALRFADIYERIHAIRAGGLAAPLMLSGLAVEAWDWRIAVKLGLLAALMAMTGPSLGHLIAHAAHRAGVEPDARATARAKSKARTQSRTQR